MSAKVVEVQCVALSEECQQALSSDSQKSCGMQITLRTTPSLEQMCLPHKSASDTLVFARVCSEKELVQLERISSTSDALMVFAIVDEPLWSIIEEMNAAHSSYSEGARLRPLLHLPSALRCALSDALETLLLKYELAWQQEAHHYTQRIMRHLSYRGPGARTMAWMLARIGSLLQAQRTYLCEFSQSQNLMDVPFEWCAPGVSSQQHRLRHTPSAQYPWFSEEICSGRAVVVHTLDDLPSVALNERVELLHEEVDSFLCVPLRQGRNSIGFIGASRTKAASVSDVVPWRESELRFLLGIAGLVSSSKLSEFLRKAHTVELEMYAEMVHSLPLGVCLFDENDTALFVNNFAQKELPKLQHHAREQAVESVEQQASRLLLEARANGVSTQKVSRQSDSFATNRAEKSFRVEEIPLLRGVSHGDYTRGHSMLLLQERTKELALSEKLGQAQKLETVGRLVGGVAHDFNNVLTAIMGYVGLVLQRLPQNHDCRLDLERAVDASVHGSELIGHLLLFAGNHSRSSGCTPDAVIEETAQSFFPLLGALTQVRLSLEAPQIRLPISKACFQQILLNLVLNAGDALPEGGEIHVRTRVDDCGEGRFYLEVSDTGHGMSEEVLARLFDPFFTTKGKGKGTGLGLATVAQIIADAQGSVKVSSQLGVGSCFTVELPVLARGVESAELAVPSKILLSSGGETILLVEDEKPVRDIMQEVLELAGYRVLTAKHGRQALRLVEEYPSRIDAVVADIVMPYLGGIELVERLQAVRPNIKVLLISGYQFSFGSHFSGKSVDGKSIDGKSVDGCRFMSKPFLPTEFSLEVRNLLQDTSGQIVRRTNGEHSALPKPSKSLQ